MHDDIEIRGACEYDLERVALRFPRRHIFLRTPSDPLHAEGSRTADHLPPFAVA